MDYKRILRILLVALPPILLLPAAYILQNGQPVNKILLLFVAVVIGAVLTAYIWIEYKELLFNQSMFVSLLTALVALISFMLPSYQYLYMPLFVSTMLIGLIINKNLAIILHGGLCLLVMMVNGLGTVFFAYYCVIGTVSAMTVHYAKERQRMLYVVGGLAVFGGVFHTLLTFVVNHEFQMTDLLFPMANIAMSLIIVIGSLPLWESIFQVMTPLKLLEFTNSDHRLMQRLMVEAPGTFHHVQMVGNLAERGAKAIGADGLLAKTGAVFHDIGKLKEPNYFIENQNGGPNPHDDIAAEDSARIIIDHVEQGMKIAKEHHLPKGITDIIAQHHGTSMVTYFFHKAQSYNDGVDYKEENFRYNGPKPQSKEAAVVMLADCVEAFVRSQPEEKRNLEKIQWIIGEVIRQKFEDGQLDESGLKIGELRAIGKGFMQVYNGLYHERISYPGKVEAGA